MKKVRRHRPTSSDKGPAILELDVFLLVALVYRGRSDIWEWLDHTNIVVPELDFKTFVRGLADLTRGGYVLMTPPDDEDGEAVYEITNAGVDALGEWYLRLPARELRS